MEKKNKIRLSIVVPCYKAEKFLPRCLDSLVSQSVKELEIICVNDSSPDACLSILRKYRERCGNRIVIIDKENEGVWKARRDGVFAASGEYIGFLDPDDYVREDFAEELLSAAKKRDADIACCGYERIDMETGRVFSKEMTRFCCESFDIQKEPGLMLEVNAALWNKIYRADMIRKMYDIASVPRALDDMLLGQLIFINARVITFVNKPLVHYMVRQDSAVHSITREVLPGIYRAAREVRRVYEEKNPALLDYLDAEAFLHLGISLMYRLAKEPDFEKILRDNTAFLDREFPRWRKNPYIKAAYAIRHRGANLKTLTVRWTYRLHVFRQFLALYRLMIRYLKVDIKW